jgi:hypothetical protein
VRELRVAGVVVREELVHGNVEAPELVDEPRDRLDARVVGQALQRAREVAALPGTTLPPVPTPYTLGNVSVRRGNFAYAPNRQRRTRNDISLNLDYKLTPSTVMFFKSTFTDYLSTNRNHSFNVTPVTVTPGFTPAVAVPGTRSEGRPTYVPSSGNRGSRVKAVSAFKVLAGARSLWAPLLAKISPVPASARTQLLAQIFGSGSAPVPRLACTPLRPSWSPPTI